ncbi:SDR family NAD(P)-dependent oxidoreductase [Mycobacterium intracellulare]|uniref:SDR family NAD(P)-dependent oxidoreductase n=1 Tax=Mycobacterium intracellulare TaxID=1767 RepID=UPI0034D626AF
MRAHPIDETDHSCEGRGRTALVTGASSGIGRSLTELLAAKGYDVIPVARRGDRLADLAEGLAQRWAITAEPIVADLGAPDAVGHIVAELRRRNTHVDVLINNAGYTLGGRFAETSWDEQERFLRVMALTPTELIHRLLPAMIERRWGRILNVASISALAPSSPQSVLYCASKSLVHKLTEGLAVETAKYNVSCTVSMPGFTATEIFQASGWGGGIENGRVLRALMMAPETVARQAYSALMARRPTIVHGWQHKAIGLCWLHAPPSIRRRLSAFTADLPLTR